MASCKSKDDMAAVAIRHDDGPLLIEHLMNKGNGNRSFADDGRHALDVAAAHVADREDSGTIRFQQMGIQKPRLLGAGIAGYTPAGSEH
jgi:hypothetical protein